MKIVVVALSFSIMVSGCVSSTTPSVLSASELAKTPATATMPAGSATYKGTLTATTNYIDTITTGNGPFTGTQVGVADFSMSANFDAKTVSATADNLKWTDKWTCSALPAGSTTPVSNERVITVSGAATGNGTISGSTFTIPSMTGKTKQTSITLNGVAQTVDASATFTDTTPKLDGKFVGDGAANIYASSATTSYVNGTQTGNGVIEATGAKQ